MIGGEIKFFVSVFHWIIRNKNIIFEYFRHLKIEAADDKNKLR